MASKKRLDPVLVAILVLAVLGALAASKFAGPVSSGALLLEWPVRETPVAHDLPRSYEPVHQGHFDFSTGLYVREDDDFVLHTTPSFVLRRTYRTLDRRSREFGVGATHNAEWFLIGDASTFQWAALILADGGRVRFDRISKGASYSDALFEHRGPPAAFSGSRLGWTGFSWLLRLQDGSTMRISACGPDGRSKCAPLHVRDSHGHRIEFKRAGTRLVEIDTGAQSIEFAYDESGRVIHAQDSSGQRVRYTYDRAGRLERTEASDGTVRLYGYDTADRMTRVEEPGRIVENTYDADGLFRKQRVRLTDAAGTPLSPEPYIYDVTYEKENGRIRRTDVRESSGRHRRTVFDHQGYLLSDTYAPDTAEAMSVSYRRAATTREVTAVTVTCPSGRWRVPRTAAVEPGREHEVTAELFQRWCSTDQSTGPSSANRY